VDEVEVGGLRIAFQRMGHGPPVVLLHGFLADSRAWLLQFPALSAEYTVVAWDAPGCGQSSDPPEGFRFPDYAHCLAGFFEAMDLKQPHLVGLSFGATLALEFYRRSQVPRSLVLASAYAGWAGSLPADVVSRRLEQALNDSGLPAEDWIPDWVRGALSSSAPSGLFELVVAALSEFHPVGYRAMARSLAEADLRDVLPRIDVPTLLLHGDSDQRSPLHVAKDLHAQIPRSKLVVLPGVGHIGSVEAPEVFNDALVTFLRSVRA
jgi:pimeloyl-ACP methyl ester carboxylesterase